MPLRVQLTVSDMGSISNNEETKSENISVGTNCSRYYYKDDNQQEYITTLSEQLESMFANFIELIEGDLFNAALEKIMECIKIAAEGMKQSTLKYVSKPVTRCQPWYDDECESFHCKTLKALRYFRRQGTFESLSTYQSFKKNYRKLIKDKKKDSSKNKLKNLKKFVMIKIQKNFGVF